MAGKIHPTAVVDKRARLGEAVEIGPHAVIEADVVIGDGCRIMAGAVIRRYTALGAGNVVHPCAVLGGEPQDYKFDPASETYLRIGSGNLFREHVSISRATAAGGATVIGDNCFFMAQSHVGHDSVVGDGGVRTNGTHGAGHLEIGTRAILSGNTLVHQFCWVGELVISRGRTGISQHVPPFVMAAEINYVAGLNVVGLRRADYVTDEDRRQLKEAYRLLYRSSLTPTDALAEMDSRADWGAPAQRFRDFVRRAISAEAPYDRGLATGRPAQRGTGR